jgi:putative NADH-flavin reductase
MNIIFKSDIKRFGSILTPHIINLCDDFLIYKKRHKNLITYEIITISYADISSVSIINSLIGTDIVIETYGGKNIKAKNFSLESANKINELIMFFKSGK